VPEPLVNQLTNNGRLIIPIQRGKEQELVLVRKQGAETLEESLGDARFVPLIGRHGFQPREESP
jgi:protein-L-isoaspartate(D-aspartate) O-methyltransferase